MRGERPPKIEATGHGRTRARKKVSAGSFFRIAFERIESRGRFWPRCLEGGRDRTAGHPRLRSCRFRFDDVVVFGSEGRGISPELLALCGERVTIPQRGVTQSLNLGVATGIILFEFLRQEDTLGNHGRRDGPVDLAGDVPLEAPHRLPLGFTLSGAPCHVLLGAWVAPKAVERHHVQRPVGVAVAARVEAVPEEAGTGAAPHRWAKAASLLSPTVTASMRYLHFSVSALARPPYSVVEGRRARL